MEKYDHKAAALIERSYQTPEIVNQRLRTLDALGLRQGEQVLDAGCGTGLLLEQQGRLVGASGRAEGIDSSEAMLEHARQRCAELEQVNLQQGSVEALPFGDAEFDALSCIQVLLYVPDLDAALREYYRVLKPGGRLAVIETDWSGAVLNNTDDDVTHRIFTTWSSVLSNSFLPRRLRPLLREAGFASVRVEAIPIVNAGYSEHSFSAGMLQNMADTAERHGRISADEARDWLAGLEQLQRDDAYFFCVNRFLFSAVK